MTTSFWPFRLPPLAVGILSDVLTAQGFDGAPQANYLESLREATPDDVGGILTLIEPLEMDGTLVRRDGSVHDDKALDFVGIEGGVGIGDHESDIVANDLFLLVTERDSESVNVLRHGFLVVSAGRSGRPGRFRRRQ